MATRARDFTQDIAPYELFMLALCVWALTLLASETLFRFDARTTTILEYADSFTCLLFFVDFVYNFARAPNRLRYMATWGWIDLLSSIPALDALRWGRAVRVVRILRVLRAIKSVRALARFVIIRRGESVLLASILLTLLMIVFSSVAILQFEVPAGGNIASAEDAAWWAVSTITTVGYGDRYPITSEGRLIAVCLMSAGVGIVGTLSGLSASWFLSPAAKEADLDRTEIKALLAEIREKLDKQQQ